MPTSTIRYVCTDIDQRIEMRGEIAALRANPHVTSVGQIEREDSARGQTTRWEVEHVDIPYPGEDSSFQALRRILNAREDGRLYDPTPSPNPPPGFTPPNTNGDSFREGIIAEYIRTQAGRSALGQSMVAPLRARMDYQSVGRRTFLVDQLPQGALPIADIVPEVPGLSDAQVQDAFRLIENQDLRPSHIQISRASYDQLLAHSSVEQRANLEQNVSAGRVTITENQQPLLVHETVGVGAFNPRGVRRLTVPHFEIASNPTINIGDIRQRRFDLIDRTPPFVWPEWAAIGAWVCLKSDPTQIATIEAHQSFTITVRMWRGIGRTETLSSAQLENWQSCTAPGPVPSRFDREEVV